MRRNLIEAGTDIANAGFSSTAEIGDILDDAEKKIFDVIRNRRGSEFKTLYRLVGNKVEALEFTISKNTRYTGVPLKNL